MMFSDIARKRLAQLLPRLSSDNDGEVVSSVRAIARVLSADGKDWHDLTKALSAKPSTVFVHSFREPSPPPQPSPFFSEWADKATACSKAAHLLSPRETEFIRDMEVRLRRPFFTPTEKQASWLDAIFHRIKRSSHAYG